MLPPVVSTVLLPPLPVSVMLMEEDQGAVAPSVPPPKLKAALPEPCVMPPLPINSRPPVRL